MLELVAALKESMEAMRNDFQDDYQMMKEFQTEQQQLLLNLMSEMKKFDHNIGKSSSVPLDFEIVSDNSEWIVEIDEVEFDVVEIVEAESISSITIDDTHLYAHNVFDQMPKETEALIPQLKCAEHGSEVQMDNFEQEEPKLDDMKVFYRSPLEESMVKFLETEVSLFSAHKLFDIMFDEKFDSNGDIVTSKVHKEFFLLDGRVKEIGVNLNHYLCNFVKVFDPGGVQGVSKLMQTPIWLAFDPGGRSHVSSWLPPNISHIIHTFEAESVVFDRGKVDLFLGDWASAMVWEIIDKLEIITKVFDMGKLSLHKLSVPSGYEDDMLIIMLQLIFTPLRFGDKYAAKGRFISYPALRARLFYGGCSMVEMEMNGQSCGEHTEQKEGEMSGQRCCAMVRQRSEVVGMKGWIVHMLKWDGYFCSIPFQPGGLQCAHVHIIYNLAATVVVFNTGKLGCHCQTLGLTKGFVLCKCGSSKVHSLSEIAGFYSHVISASTHQL